MENTLHYDETLDDQISFKVDTFSKSMRVQGLP